MIRFLKWFKRGEVLLVSAIVAICVTGRYLKKAHDRRDAQTANHGVQRPLGRVDATTAVDRANPPEERVLSNQPLLPSIEGNAPVPQPVAALAKQTAAAAKPVPSRTISMFYSAPTPTPAPAPEVQKVSSKKPEAKYWLPAGSPIPCQLAFAINSARMNGPVLGEITENVYAINDGYQHLILPAGTLVKCWTNSGAIRDRVEVAGTWMLTFQEDGRSIKVPGVAAYRDADAASRHFGPEDGTSGIPGVITESDHWAAAKGWLGLVVGGAWNGAQTLAGTALMASHTAAGFQLPDSTPYLMKYMDQALNGQTGDAKYVHVDSATPFYLWTSKNIYPLERSIDGGESHGDEARQQEPTASKPLSPSEQMMDFQKSLLKASQQTKDKDDEPKAPHYAF